MTIGYLNTRGRERHRDYQFIGPAPPTSWWRAYAEHTTFERPTVLVQGDERSWQAYLSGIPSRRRDAVDTVIRYTVVVEGSGEDASAGGLSTGDVLALVATWLADQDRGRADGRVSAVLDAAFPEPEVERLIAAGPDVTDAAEVSRRLATALRELHLPDRTEPEPPAGQPVTPDWLADLHSQPGRADFLQRVDAVLAGQPGRALVLNLVASVDDLTGLIADPRPLAVLAVDLPDPATTVPLNRAPAKKAPPPPGPSHPGSAVPAIGQLRGCLRLIMVPIALLLMLALALFGTLFYLR